MARTLKRSSTRPAGAALWVAVMAAWLPGAAAGNDAEPRHPGSGLRLRIGYATGGEPVISGGLNPNSHQSLAAGEGWVAAIAITATPLWTADGAGFGAAVEVGWKRSAERIDAETFTLTRAPIAALLHLLLPVEHHLYLVMSGGACKDVAIRLEGASLGAPLTLDFTSSVGAIAEVGVLYRWTDAFSLEIAGRYTGITYRGNGNDDIDGTSYGLSVGARYDL